MEFKKVNFILCLQIILGKGVAESLEKSFIPSNTTINNTSGSDSSQLKGFVTLNDVTVNSLESSQEKINRKINSLSKSLEKNRAEHHRSRLKLLARVEKLERMVEAVINRSPQDWSSGKLQISAKTEGPEPSGEYLSDNPTLFGFEHPHPQQHLSDSYSPPRNSRNFGYFDPFGASFRPTPNLPAPKTSNYGITNEKLSVAITDLEILKRKVSEMGKSFELSSPPPTRFRLSSDVEETVAQNTEEILGLKTKQGELQRAIDTVLVHFSTIFRDLDAVKNSCGCGGGTENRTTGSGNSVPSTTANPTTMIESTIKTWRGTLTPTPTPTQMTPTTLPTRTTTMTSTTPYKSELPPRPAYYPDILTTQPWPRFTFPSNSKTTTFRPRYTLTTSTPFWPVYTARVATTQWSDATSSTAPQSTATSSTPDDYLYHSSLEEGPYIDVDAKLAEEISEEKNSAEPDNFDFDAASFAFLKQPPQSQLSLKSGGPHGKVAFLRDEGSINPGGSRRIQRDLSYLTKNLQHLTKRVENQRVEIDVLSSKLATINVSNAVLLKVMEAETMKRTIRPRDCSEIKLLRDMMSAENDSAATGPKAQIYPKRNDEGLMVLCDLQTAGGGWTILQRRGFNSSENFYRDYRDYEAGFGSLDGDFWLGLSNIAALTQGNDQELRIEMSNWEGVTRFAAFRHFKVENASELYRLRVSGFSGNAGDSLSRHNGMAFSTYDQDHDTDRNRNCASMWKGAWWYHACHESNLNGLYAEDGSKGSNYFGTGIVWYSWMGNYHSLKLVEIKTRNRFLVK